MSIVLDRIDLNAHLAVLDPYKQDLNCYHCPVCAGKLSISTKSGELYTCIASGCSRYQIRLAIEKLAGIERPTYSEEFQELLDRRQTERETAERNRIAALRTEKQRDREWRAILGGSFLSASDRQDMLNRGYTPDQIVASKARSIGGGRVMPIHTATGLMVGSQVIKPTGKSWYGTPRTHHLRETGELPLAVVYPSAPKSGFICYTESVGDKPFLTAHRFGRVTIGSSNIGSQPKDLARSITTIEQRYNWHEIVHVIMPDAGCLINLQVMSNYVTLAQQLLAIGGRVRFAWWGQLAKIDGDIDEISTDTQIQLLPPRQFLDLFRSYLALMSTIVSQHDRGQRLSPQQLLHLLTV
jgi:hypothetical protein